MTSLRFAAACHIPGTKPSVSKVVAAGFLLLALASPSVACAQDGASLQRYDLTLFNPDDYIALDAQSGSAFDGRQVETASGAFVGRVAKVEVAPDGSPERLKVGLDAGGFVWIAADALRLNKNTGMLLTNLKDADLSADGE